MLLTFSFLIMCIHREPLYLLVVPGCFMLRGYSLRSLLYRLSYWLMLLVFSFLLMFIHLVSLHPLVAQGCYMLRGYSLRSLLYQLSYHLCSRSSSEKQKMAGLLGFEPRLHGIKTRCLTAWLQPN